MATTDYNVAFDYRFIKEFSKYCPEFLQRDLDNLSEESLLSGIVQRDRVMEIACAHTSGGLYTVISEDGRDFTDDSDMKTTTCNYRPSAPQPQVLVTSITNKVGILRVVTLDPKDNTFHYFAIWDYASVRSYGRIEFGLHSNSKYTNGECGLKFDSFEEMCKFTRSMVNR